MSNKEKVLAYFEEWAGKGVNLSNEISVIVSNHGMACMDWCDESVFSFPLESGTDLAFMRAARILKLDPPIAAPIVWKDWLVIRGRKVRYSACDTYMLERVQGCGVMAYYIGDDRRMLVGSRVSGIDEERLYNDCQDHKQKQFNQLGGYNA